MKKLNGTTLPPYSLRSSRAASLRREIGFLYATMRSRSMTKRKSILSLLLGGILLSIPQAYSQQIKSGQVRKPAVNTSAVSTQSWELL